MMNECYFDSIAQCPRGITQCPGVTGVKYVAQCQGVLRNVLGQG